MSENQARLMQRCIAAVRLRYEREAEGDHRRDYELVEVFPLMHRTAHALVEAGVLVWDMPQSANEFTNAHVRLPRTSDMPDFFTEGVNDE